MNQPKNPSKYLLFSLLLILIDQTSKLLVHKYMEPGFSGQILLLGTWLKLHYVLNPGMAFGMQLGHEYGKLFLTLFRLFAMCAIGWYLVHLARSGASKGLLWALSMILAGAVGNVIDSTFYGVFLDNAPYGSPTPWFHGQVIDMIFVDFWEGFIPDWVPVWGGQYYSTPIFNIADSCIFVGVCSILIFQGSFHQGTHDEEEENLPGENPDHAISEEPAYETQAEETQVSEIAVSEAPASEAAAYEATASEATASEAAASEAAASEFPAEPSLEATPYATGLSDHDRIEAKIASEIKASDTSAPPVEPEDDDIKKESL